MGKGSDPPPPPDYGQVATQQGELNEEALNRSIWANRPTQVTPWGGVNWVTETAIDPSTGQEVTQWTQNQTLDPRLQRSLEGQFGIGEDRTALAGDITGQLRGAMGTPMDFESFRGIPETEMPGELRQRAEDAAYGRATSRLDPQWEQASADMDIRLRNQGLMPGDEAYDRAMGNLNRARTDAYEMARMGAVGEGRAEAGQMFTQQQQRQAQELALRQQEIAEALQQRTMPLEEVNMLLAGQGVQPPGTPGYTAAGMATPADMMGAAQLNYDAQADIYNARQAQRQGLMSGIAGGASLLPIGISMFG